MIKIEGNIHSIILIIVFFFLVSLLLVPVSRWLRLGSLCFIYAFVASVRWPWCLAALSGFNLSLHLSSHLSKCLGIFTHLGVYLSDCLVNEACLASEVVDLRLQTRYALCVGVALLYSLI